MSNKKRLYEVFSKVNKLSLNEEDEQERWDNFVDSVENEISSYFRQQSRLFENGVPNQIKLNTIDFGEVILNIVEDDHNGIEHYQSFEDQIQYVATYRTTINDIPIIIRIPFTVSIEKNYTGNLTEFYTKTFMSPQDIDVDIRR